MIQNPPPSLHPTTDPAVPSQTCSLTTIPKQPLRLKNSSSAFFHWQSSLMQWPRPALHVLATRRIGGWVWVHSIIDYKNLSVTNITLATPSKGMNVVQSQPRAAWHVSLADLIQQTLVLTKEFNHFCIRFKYPLMQMIEKTLSAHMLNGNFATNKVTRLKNKANSINPSAFLPQRNTCMVNQERLKDMISKT